MYVRHLLCAAASVLFSISIMVGCSNPAGDENAARAPGSTATTVADANQTPESVAQAPAESPEAVVKKFIDAGNSGDKATFDSLLTQKAREEFADGAELNKESAIENYTIGETVIDGDLATVAVNAEDDEKPIDITMHLRQENAAWRVFGMDMGMGDGNAFKVNFEEFGGMMNSVGQSMATAMGDAMGDAMSQAFQTSPDQIAAERAKYDALQAISEEEYEASWKNAADLKGMLRKDAVSKLAEAIGLPVDFGDHEEAFAGDVKADATGLSMLEAIDRIAGEAGLYVVFPDPEYGGGALLKSMAKALTDGMTQIMENSGVSVDAADAAKPSSEPEQGALTFATGERPYPVLYAGPFAVEVTSVEEDAPNTTGTLGLTIRAYGLDPGLLSLLQNSSRGTEFDAIADAKGRPLVDEDVTYLGGGTSDGVRYADAYSIDLRNLIREVDAIATIAGTQRLQRPDAIVELAFDDASEGATAKTGGFSGTIKTAGDYTEIVVNTPQDFDTDNVAVMGVADDSDGNPINASYVSAMSWKEAEVGVSMNLDAAPAAVRVKLVSKMDVKEYPFKFTNIRLQHAAEQPEKVEELSFEGDVPVSVKYIEVTDPDPDFAKIRVSVTNHSNKDAKNISLNLVYLDAKGDKLDDFPAGLSGEFEFANGEMVAKPAAAKNSTGDLETTAFNMPENTKDVRIEVTMIDFADGTRWQAED